MKCFMAFNLSALLLFCSKGNSFVPNSPLRNQRGVPSSFNQPPFMSGTPMMMRPFTSSIILSDETTGLDSIASSLQATPLSSAMTVLIFLIGVFPFAVATVEFWRRIAVGEPFGTGADQVVFTTIGEDNAPASSRGRRVLGRDSMITAYILFAVAAGVLGISIYSIATSDVPPPVLLSAGTDSQ